MQTKRLLLGMGVGLAVTLVPAASSKPRISCTIGERMWQDRWGGMDFR